MIPKYMHFTFDTTPTDLPAIYKENLKSWKAACPDWDIRFYSKTNRLEFFNTYFPDHIANIKKIQQSVVIADLFRYAALYIFGGMYNDIDTFPLQPIPNNWLSYESVIGYEYQPSRFKCEPIARFNNQCIIGQWSLLSKPQNPLFKHAFEQSMKNLANYNYHCENISDILKATGPILFTEIAQTALNNPKTLVLNMDVFAPIRLPTIDLSQCIVFHQFHGMQGWKPQLTFEKKLPHLKWF